MAEAPRPFFSKRILLFIAFGLLTLALYLYYFVGANDVVNIIQRVVPLYYFSAFIAFVISIIFASLTWRSLLDNLAVKVKMRRVFFFMWVGMFFDATVPEPGWSGDLSKAYMLAKTSDKDVGRVVASVVSQKIIGMAVTVIDLIFGLVLLATTYLFSQEVLIFIIIVMILTISSLGLIWYLSTRPKATTMIVDRLIRLVVWLRRGRWDPTGFRVKTEEFLEDFHESIRTLASRPKSLARPVLYSLISLFFDVSVVFLTFASLGYPIPFDKVLIIYALTGTLQIMGISFVGFTEVIVSGAYTILGIPAALSISVTLLTRVITLWFKLVVSYFAFQYAGLKILKDNKPTHLSTPQT